MFRTFPLVKIHQDIDLDRPIYRFVPYEHIDELLDEKILFFRNIEYWDDPWENPTRYIDCSINTIFYVTKQLSSRYYATCWSLNTSSEGLWKAYSHNLDFVRIRTTPRKLLLAIGLDIESEFDCFIAPVIYTNMEDLNVVKDIVDNNETYLKYYLPVFLKREMFSYENEVRFAILALPKNEGFSKHVISDGDKKRIYLRLPKGHFIDNVELDPRLQPQEAKLMKERFLQYGIDVSWNSVYSIPEKISISTDYEYPFDEIPDMCRLWDGREVLTMKDIKEIIEQGNDK